MMTNYTFEVRVNGTPARVYTKSSTITGPVDFYIEGRRGSEYSLYFHNNTACRVLAIFSVDGLDVIEGKVAGKESRGYVVNTYSSVEVPGWTLNNSKVAKFQFRPQGDRDNPTYIEELKNEGFQVDAGNQGVIGVMVIPEKVYPPAYITLQSYPTYPYPPTHIWTGGVPVQGGFYGGANIGASFSAQNSAAATPRAMNMVHDWAPVESSLGTGFGEDKSFNTTETTFNRDPFALVWTKVYTYDTLANLKRLGVIVETPPLNKAFPQGVGCHVPNSRRV